MGANPLSRSLYFFVFFLSCSVQFIPGVSDDSSGASDAVKPKGKISTVAIIVIVLVVVSLGVTSEVQNLAIIAEVAVLI
ncbi:hypothetical protein K1719_021640 [Acacia pycnantha]|nr:hypothetical protein K1719_021640 [Acacia pycnantha]